MKKLTVKFFAMVTMLLCASATTFAAVDWSKYDFLGDGAGGGKYNNKYKVEAVDGMGVINIQKPGFAAEDGIYLTFPAGILECSVEGAIQGAGIVVYLSNFIAQETEVTVKYAPANEATFHVFYADGVAAGGEQTLTSIKLTASANVVKVGESINLTAAALDQVGLTMKDVEVTLAVSPAEAGTIEDGAFKAAKAGLATITATAGEITNSINVFCYEGENLALSTAEANKVIATSMEKTDGNYNSLMVVDGNLDTYYILHDNTADTDEARTYDAWFVLDLGACYDINLITINFEGACSQEYHVDFSFDNVVWATAYTYTGKAGVDNTRNDAIFGEDLKNSKGIRYVRFFNTKAATNYGVKIFEMQVFGVEGAAPADTEKPVMGTATLVSNNHEKAVIAVEATDNMGISAFHVVDADNKIDAKVAPVEGNITVTGLTPSTTYNFTITAIDLVGNESENTAAVKVVTPDYLSAPTEAAPAPTHPANKVRAIYSATYNADCSFGEWDSGTTLTDDEYGKKYVTSNLGYFGLEGFAFNCSEMETLHLDVWAADDMKMRIVPIHGGAEVGVFVNIEGQKWNSIEIALTEFEGVTNWTNVPQIKIDNVANKTFWLNNVYFYTRGETTGVDEVTTTSAMVQKVVEDGQVIIIRDGVRYNALGAQL